MAVLAQHLPCETGVVSAWCVIADVDFHLISPSKFAERKGNMNRSKVVWQCQNQIYRYGD